jgi:putative tryptophan/tyrosine transport system substrate-binding protein
MKRREFIRLLGGAAAWPLAARAQQAAMPVVGFLGTASPRPFAHLVAGFRRGLQETGFVEDRSVVIEYRWAEGQYDRVPALAADLVRRQVAVIVTVGGETSAAAAKAATETIPIVFNVGSDPVKIGLVASLARPGGNATGVNIFTIELVEKRLGLLLDLIPTASSIAILVNPDFVPAAANASEAEAAARAVGKQVVIYNARSEIEIGTAFAIMAQARPGALLVGADPFFNSRRGLIVALAGRHAIPAIYEWREFAEAGGLISYGTSLVEAYRQQGIYAGRILKGEKPADLPVVQPKPVALPPGRARLSTNPAPTALLQELRQLGWTGRNARIDIHWAGADAESIRKHAAELATLGPDVILANGSVVVAPLLQATRTVPIVFVVAARSRSK